MAKETASLIPAGIQLDRNSNVPLYMQLYAQFKNMLARGSLKPGDRIPSSRTLAAELSVSRIIVSQCFELLSIEGYFEGKTGAGTFIAKILPEELLQVKTAGNKTNTLPTPAHLPATNNTETGTRIEDKPFQVGLPALDKFPYSTWQKVAANVMRSLRHYHLGYEDALGYEPLRNAIADYLRVARGVNCNPAQVIVVTGSQQSFNLVIQALLTPGNSVWMEDPGYHGAAQAFSFAQLNVCPIPVQTDGIDIDYALQHCPNARLAYVTPTHQFPTGYTLSSEKRQQLLQWAAENNSWILEDDYDSEYRYEGTPTPCLQHMDNNNRVIYTGTFSKVLFPGLRLAYLVLPSTELIHRFRSVKESIDRQSPAIEQFILSDFITQGHFSRHIHKMRLLYADRRHILITLLQQKLHPYLSITLNPVGMHLLCHIINPVNLTVLKTEIRHQQLRIIFLERFTLQHHQNPALILGFTAYSTYRLKTAVDKLLTCFELATAYS